MKTLSAGLEAQLFNNITDATIESAALNNYKAYGRTMEHGFGIRWKSTWKRCYERPQGTTPDILTELNNIKDTDAKRYVPLYRVNREADQGKAAWQLCLIILILSKSRYIILVTVKLSGLLYADIAEQAYCSVIC
ncbi:MAG: hypothetical protein U5K51_14455 [Flavobacteriaceae bacterium]|nr:hypothetical protein [Flavobacteriaceae bacterium]